MKYKTYFEFIRYAPRLKALNPTLRKKASVSAFSLKRTLFCSGVQMLGRYPNYKLAEYEREGITLPAEKGDFETIAEYPCDFLSFSCYGSHVVTCHDDAGTPGEGNGGARTHPPGAHGAARQGARAAAGRERSKASGPRKERV